MEETFDDDENGVELDDSELDITQSTASQDLPAPSAPASDINTLSDEGDALKSGVYFSPERLKFNPNGNPFVVVINPDEWDDVAVMESVMAQLSNSYLQDKRVYAKLVETLAMAVRCAPNIIRSALESPEALENWVKSIGRSVGELTTQVSDVQIETPSDGVSLEPQLEMAEDDASDEDKGESESEAVS